MIRIVKEYSFFLVALACAIPVFLPMFPPMVDLPQHASIISAIDHLVDGNFPYEDQFQIKLLHPYWVGYLLIWLLSKLCGIVLASKIVISLAIIAFLLACREVRKFVGAPPILDWLFVSVPFGFSYYWGFLSFLIALPLGILFIKYYLKYLQDEWHWGWVVIALHVLFFAHILVTGFIICVCFLLTITPQRGLKYVVKTVLPLISITPIVVLWLLINFSISGGDSAQGPWEMGIHRITQLLPGIFSFQSSWWNAAISAGLLSVPWLLGGRIRPTIARSGPFLFYVIFMLLAPNYLFGNFYTYNRFNCMGLVLYILAFQFPGAKQPNRFAKVEPVLAISIPAVAVLLLFRITLHHHIYSVESKTFEVVLESMEAEKRVLSLVENRGNQYIDTPVYLHYPLWYGALNNGLVDFNFAYWPGFIVAYKEEFQPTAGANFVWFPRTFDWDYHQASQYDYFIVKANEDFVRSVMGRYSDRLKLRVKVGDWWLFSKANVGQIDN